MAVRALRRFPLGQFRADRSGAVVPMFALALVPLMGALGAAVDYGRANSVRTSIQAALDSTALMLSKEASGLSKSALNAKANAYFKALFTRGDASTVKLAIKFEQPTRSSFALDVSGASSVDTTFMKVLGIKKIDVKTASQVTWGFRNLELALALDNTGSMASSNKMANLKLAAKNLINTMKTKSKVADDIKVSIVPFDTTVNIGTEYKDQDWFDFDSLDCNGAEPGSGCTVTNWKDHWQGCVRDRTHPNDTRDIAPAANANRKFPAHKCGSLAKMLPLTSDWTALSAKIDEMQPNGMTNVTMGLAWAWHSLSPNAPLSQGAAANPELDKVIIILTDGLNTEAWKNSNNTTVTAAGEIDARTALICDNIKKDKVQIYAIRVIEGNADLLRNCASSTTMFYDVQDASQLDAVFKAIADSLANLRISK